MNAGINILQLPHALIVSILTQASWRKVLQFAQAASCCNLTAGDRHLWEVLLQQYDQNYLTEAPVYSGKDCRALFKRHVANIPSHLMYRLCDHDDEILHIEFSHNGQLLATASRDGFTLVYDFVCTPPGLLHRIPLDSGLGNVGSKVITT